jgi:mRNA interferase MazF
VVLQADDLSVLSTVIVAPTSTSAPAQPFRPEINVRGRRTRVLVEQLAAIDHSRLGGPAGALSRSELEEVDRALAMVVGLSRYTRM